MNRIITRFVSGAALTVLLGFLACQRDQEVPPLVIVEKEIDRTIAELSPHNVYLELISGGVIYSGTVESVEIKRADSADPLARGMYSEDGIFVFQGQTALGDGAKKRITIPFWWSEVRSQATQEPA